MGVKQAPVISERTSVKWMLPLQVLEAAFLSSVSCMQEEALEKFASQIGSGKCSEADGRDLYRKFPLCVKALITTRQ